MIEASTEHLPFLVVHGAWLWPVVLAALFAGIVVGIHLRLLRRARHHARVMAGSLEIGGDRCVRGELGGSPDPLASTLCAELRGGAQELSMRRAPEVWIETSDGRILLDGPIQVIAGSRAAAARNGVPRAVSTEELAAATTRAPWIHRPRLLRRGDVGCATRLSVDAGDEVVATGDRLERAPAGSNLYREARSVWRLVGSERMPIQIAARRPRSAALRMTFQGIAGLMLVVGLGGYGVMRGLASTWLRACDHPIDDPDGLSNLDACSLASAMPGAWHEALWTLLRRVEEHPARSSRALDRILGLAELAQGCRAVVDRLFVHDRYEAAGRQAHACGLPVLERKALVLEGRLAEAIAIPDDDPDHDTLGASLWIAGGEWRAAAEAIEARRETYARETRSSNATNTHGRRLVYYDCLAELLRSYGGDPGAPERLRKLRAGPHGDVCTPMELELAAPEKRGRLVEARAAERDSDEARLFDVLAWSLGLADDYSPAPYDLLLTPETQGRNALRAWLVVPDPEKLPADVTPARRAEILRWIAAAQILDGEVARAEQTARDARDPPRTLQQPAIPVIEAAVSLYSAHGGPKTIAPELRTRRRLGLRAGKPTQETLISVRYNEALNAALRGDGDALAREMALNAWDDGDLLAVLPWIQRGREDVIRQLAWSAPAPQFPYAPISVQLIRSAMRRTVLALAGADDEAARWDAIYRRFDAMLSDRRRAVALFLAER